MLRRPHSEETRRKIGLANAVPRPERRGEKSPSWKGGKPRCEVCQKLLSGYSFKRCKSHKTITDAFRESHRRGQLKRKQRDGFINSPIARLRLSLSNKGRKCQWLGEWNKKHPRFGALNHNWKLNRTSLLERHRLRGVKEWAEWRNAVFERDNFTCQECGTRGGYLEPHHIIPLCRDMSRAYRLTNGITLCRPCHAKTIRKESDFAEKYSALVVAQM